MKKIYESPANSIDELGESATILHVYALTDHEEYEELNAMSDSEKEKYFGVCSQYNVMPGSLYRTYDFMMMNDHVIMSETLALNV